jgi:hypothetical protein
LGLLSWPCLISRFLGISIVDEFSSLKGLFPDIGA